MIEFENPFKRINESIRKSFRISDVNSDYIKPATSISKDHAVLNMLERKFDISFKGLDKKDEEHQSESLLEKCLTNYIKKIQKNYQSSGVFDLFQNGDRIRDQHDQLESVKETADKYLCAIEDELAKGEQSELRIDQRATTNPENPYITVMSLAKWAKKEFNIEFFPPEDQLTFKGLNITQEENLESIENDSRTIDAIELQITFALLVDDFSSSSNLFHHLHDGRPKVGPIAKKIIKQIANRENLDAQSERKIIDRINDAIEAKKQLSSRLSPVLHKRLQITLGLLVQASAPRYPDPNGDPDTTKIAEHLATNAIDLPGQDRLSIEERLQEALEVRKKKRER